MSDVTAGEIAEARADLKAELLPDEGTILRVIEASDGAGGRTEEWRERETVRCRVDPYGTHITRYGGGEGQVIAERLENRRIATITLPAETDVNTLDRIRVGETTWEVTLLRERGAWELVRMVETKELF